MCIKEKAWRINTEMLAGAQLDPGVIIVICAPDYIFLAPNLKARGRNAHLVSIVVGWDHVNILANAVS